MAENADKRIDTKGFVLTHSDENNATKGFCSSEYTTTGYRPYVTVTYENPTTAPSLQEYEIEIPLGEDYTITVNNEIGTPTFTSANELIASVNSSGTVCGDNAGSTTIAVNVDGYTLYCVVHVVMDNGTYRISSRSANLPIGTSGSIGNGTLLTTVASTTANPAYAFQLWQITHVIGAQYTIRPYYKQDMALTVLNGAVVLQQIGFDNAAVLAEHRWEISYTSSGYTLKHAGANSAALKTFNSGSSAGISIGIGPYSSTAAQYHWSIYTALGAPSGALLYDVETNMPIPSTPTKHLALEEGKSLGALGLKAVSYPASTSAANTFTWSVSNSHASYSSATSQFTGNSAGSATVTGTNTNGTVTFNLTVHPVANGTYYIENKHSSKFVDICFPYEDNTTIESGLNIHQMTLHSSFTQRWVFTHLGDGTYSIHSACDSTKYYLAVANNATTEDQPIILRTKPIDIGMKWIITYAENGTFKLTPLTGLQANSELVLALEDGITGVAINDGFMLQQRKLAYVASEKAEWYIHPIDVQLNTPLIPQQTASWCWVACAHMLARTRFPNSCNYGNNSVILEEQRSAVYEVFGDDSANYSSYDWLEDELGLGRKGGLYTHVGEAAAYLAGLTNGDITYSAYATPYTESGVIHFLQHGYPVARLYGWATFNVPASVTYEDLEELLLEMDPNWGGHVTVITGVRWDEHEQCHYFTIYDPEPVGLGSIYEMTYQEMLYNISVSDNTVAVMHLWFPTVVTQTSFSEKATLLDYFTSRDYSSNP